MRDDDGLFRSVPERGGRLLYRAVRSPGHFSTTAVTPRGRPGNASDTAQSAVNETAPVTPSPPHRPLHRAPAEHAQPDDAQVRLWKRTWVSGAESQWAGISLLANPHKDDSSRAAAWRAGWHWAESQPDRAATRPGALCALAPAQQRSIVPPCAPRAGRGCRPVDADGRRLVVADPAPADPRRARRMTAA